MSEHFEIDVPINNSTRIFEAEFKKTTYSYQIAVFIDGHEIIFEPDEERNFRAIAKRNNYKPSMTEAIQATAGVLTQLFRNKGVE